jgi:hypothetical protein
MAPIPAPGNPEEFRTRDRRLILDHGRGRRRPDHDRPAEVDADADANVGERENGQGAKQRETKGFFHEVF